MCRMCRVLPKLSQQKKNAVRNRSFKASLGAVKHPKVWFLVCILSPKGVPFGLFHPRGREDRPFLPHNDPMWQHTTVHYSSIVRTMQACAVGHSSANHSGSYRVREWGAHRPAERLTRASWRSKCDATKFSHITVIYRLYQSYDKSKYK